MKTLRSALLATSILALPVVAQAQPVSGFYVGAGAGVNLLQESDISLSSTVGNNLGARSGSAEFNYGYVGVVSLGWGYGNGVRVELEGSYRQNEVDDVSGFSGALTRPVRASGDAKTYGLMLNALYDFDLGPGSFFTPYVGVGAGYAWHQYDGFVARGANQNALFINDLDGRFAYQAIVGAAFPIASVPGLAITAEYRFLGTLEPSINATSSGGARGTADVDNYNHSLLLGLRYAFGVTPPPPAPVAPAPAAAPAPARTFLVFFDFDRADLTDRARQIIAEAATNAQSTGTTRIEVAGHADTVGTPQYNQALSQRRAAAVAAELERRGVARSNITTQGFGFTRPLVPTGPNVREPQNRRVEIVLR